MKKTYNVLSVIALILTIIGALNWLLIGIFQFNLVTWITFGLVWLERTIYILVGLSGLYMLAWLIMARGRMYEGTHYEDDDYEGKYTTKHATNR